MARVRSRRHGDQVLGWTGAWWSWGLMVMAALLVWTRPAWGHPQQGEEADPAAGTEDLAKKLQNPVSDLVSVPFQFNWAQPVGGEGQSRFILNIQPVIPFAVTDDLNLVVRLIQPLISQPALGAGGSPASGLGDTLLSFFLAPDSTEPFIWGVGPYLVMPTGAGQALGSGRWSVGPTAVLLKQSGPLTYGALVNQAWSFAGASQRADVSQMYLQPFVSFTTASALGVALNAEALANWKARPGERWTIPLNLLVSQVATFGPFPASYGVGAGYYVATPAGTPDWQLRLVITLLLPKST